MSRFMISQKQNHFTLYFSFEHIYSWANIKFRTLHVVYLKKNILRSFVINIQQIHTIDVKRIYHLTLILIKKQHTNKF